MAKEERWRPEDFFDYAFCGRVIDSKYVLTIVTYAFDTYYLLERISE